MSFDQFRVGYPLSGLLIGFLVGLTGVGGGSLMTPLLIIIFGMRSLNAVGVDLLFAAITKAVGTAVHGSAQTVEWRVAGRMLAGSIPMALITLGLLGWLGAPSAKLNQAVSKALGWALILTAVSVALRPYVTEWARRRFGSVASRHAVPFTIGLGALLGVLVPMTSVGAAALGMPILLLLYPTTPSVRLVGADIAHAVPLTLVAGLGHLFVRSIDPVLLLALVGGSVPGVIFGSLASGRVPDRLLRYCLSAALVLAGLKLLS